ncbi:hypothetical protein SDC9_175859 [bioreactor metagenome]|uniref:Uncharacterized protein n=1 Tax=bioreactor metagenome TaxID=1076179 RepID=A0A645GNC6_9ZZZZ
MRPLLGGFVVVSAVGMEAHELRSVEKAESEKVRKQQAAEVFAAAGNIVLARAGDDVFLDRSKFGCDVGLEPQFGFNGNIALGDLRKGFVKAQPARVLRIAEVEKVGDLLVAGESLARCARHNILSRLVGKDDVLNLCEILGVAETGSTEFDYLNGHLVFLPFLSLRGFPQIYRLIR